MQPIMNITQTLHQYLQLVRAPNGITALSNILGAAVVCAALAYPTEFSFFSGPILIKIALLCFASLCLYFAGMALNDICDFDEDLAERAQRPLPSGRISRRAAKLLVAVLMLLGLSLSYAVSLTSFYIAVALSVNIALYDSLLKNGMTGAITMAACRYFNWLLGLSILPLTQASFILPLPIFFYIVGLTYLSKQETLAESRSSLFITTSMLILALTSLLYIQITILKPNLIAWCLMGAWTALVSYRLLITFKNFSPSNIQSTIMWMIIGIIPLDALLSALSGNYLICAILLLLIYPCRLLSKKLYMT